MRTAFSTESNRNGFFDDREYQISYGPFVNASRPLPDDQVGTHNQLNALYQSRGMSDLYSRTKTKTSLQRLCNEFENLREVRCDRESF
jgi:hypothetical protein